jgi:hypothetical protein
MIEIIELSVADNADNFLGSRTSLCTKNLVLFHVCGQFADKIADNRNPLKMRVSSIPDK